MVEIVFSTNGSRTNEYPYGKKEKLNLNPHFTEYTQINSKNYRIFKH